LTRKDATGRSHEDEKTPLIGPRSARVIVAIAVGAAAYALPLPVGTAEDASFARDASVEEAWIDDLPSGESAAAAARCPEGHRIVGGGVGTTGPVSPGLDYTVELSGPLDFTGDTANTDDGDEAVFWYASVHNSSTAPRDFKVFALCSQTIGARIQAEPINDLPSGQSAVATVTCPVGYALAGGVGTTGPVSAGLDYTVELSSPPPGSGSSSSWYASVHNTSGSPQDFKVFALCALASGTIYRSTGTINDLPPGQSAAAAVSCPGGLRLDGGGVEPTWPASSALSAGLDYTVEVSGPLDETGSTANTDDLDAAYFWYASIHNTSAIPQDFWVWALCMKGSDAAIQAELFQVSPPTVPGGVGAGGGGGDVVGAAGACAGKPTTLVGTSGPDTLTGTSIADVIAGLGGNDVLKGLGANDRICGGPGKDRLSGGAGADFLTGGPAADRIFGGPGRDRIIGGPGKDSCAGGPAVDKESNC
jgi:hypothetical protein